MMEQKEFYERWKNNHISLITDEDVRDLSRVENIQKLQTLIFSAARTRWFPTQPEQAQAYTGMRTCLRAKLVGDLEKGVCPV